MMMASLVLLTKCVVVPNNTVNRLPLSASSAFRKVQKVTETGQRQGVFYPCRISELKKRLIPEQEYWNTKTPGTYHCVCCESLLFESSTKYNSGTGWPSYYQPMGNNVKSKLDLSVIFMPREEVLCFSCDAHLGHVFDDCPPPTGKRHCINRS